jgi:glycosyltransferase 2 family protein
MITIASGVFVGIVVLAVGTAGVGAIFWRLLCLLAVLGVLLMPGVFNRLAERVSRPFRSADAPALPAVGADALFAGMAITACGWLLQGGVLWALVQDLAPDTWTNPARDWLHGAAYTGIAYAAGFLVLTSPGGLGVRDLLIQQFLAHELGATMSSGAAELAVLIAVVLRLLWTTMDVVAAGICYWLPSSSSPPLALESLVQPQRIEDGPKDGREQDDQADPERQAGQHQYATEQTGRHP